MESSVLPVGCSQGFAIFCRNGKISNNALFGVFGFGWLVGLDRFHPRKQPLINPITGVALEVDERTVLVVLVFWWCGCGRAGGFDEGV